MTENFRPVLRRVLCNEPFQRVPFPKASSTAFPYCSWRICTAFGILTWSLRLFVKDQLPPRSAPKAQLLPGWGDETVLWYFYHNIGV